MKILSFNEKEEILSYLNKDEVIAIPTETVYGLAVLSSSLNAFNNLVKVKERSPDKPFTLMVSNIKMIEKYCYVNDLAKKLINKYMPGSITLLLPKKENIPEYLHLNSLYIGIRMPENKDLLDFINYVNQPLLVPSANKANNKPCLTCEQIIKEFNKNDIACIVKNDYDIKNNLPSTIILVKNDDIELIREGPIKFDDIRKELDI